MKKRILDNLNVRNRLLLFFLIGSLIPLIFFGFILLKVSNEKMRDEVAETYVILTKQIDDLFTQFTSMTDSIMRSVDVSDDVSQYLRIHTGFFDATVEEVQEMKEEAQDFLHQLVEMNPQVYSVSAITMDGQMLTYSQNGYERSEYQWDDEYYTPLKDSTGEMVIMPVRETRYSFSEPVNVYSVGFKHMDRISEEGEFSGGYTGYIVIECLQSTLDTIYQSAMSRSEGIYFLLDSHNTIMSTSFDDNEKGKQDFCTELENLLKAEKNDGTTVQEKTLSAGKYMIVSNPSEETGWKAVACIPSDYIAKRLSPVQVTFLLVCLLVVAIVFLISWYLSRSFTKPIYALKKNMSTIRKGNLQLEMEYERNDEFGELYDGFNKLVSELNDLIEREAEAKQTAEIAQYRMLMSQINPHFLYNTIDSIRMIAVIHKDDQVSEALVHLSDMFRYLVKDPEEWVCVEEEWEQAKNYLELQKLRFDEELEVLYQVDERALDKKMPKCILQPILENAFTHAFINMKGQMRLTITIEQQGDRVVFVIRDNGVGMEKEKLQILQKDIVEEERGHIGIGLSNVNKRLRLHFSEEYQLKISSEERKGTEITFSVPAKGGSSSGL